MSAFFQGLALTAAHAASFVTFALFVVVFGYIFVEAWSMLQSNNDRETDRF